MKQFFRTTACCIVIALLITACKEEEETFPTHEPPVWNVNHSAGYYENMTAVVKIPNNLAQYASKKDQLAAFAGNECRGVGELIDGSYFVSIKGAPEDQSTIRFKYYSAKNKYLYQTDDLFSFDANRIFGTADEPKELPLNVVK